MVGERVTKTVEKKKKKEERSCSSQSFFKGNSGKGREGGCADWQKSTARRKITFVSTHARRLGLVHNTYLARQQTTSLPISRCHPPSISFLPFLPPLPVSSQMFYPSLVSNHIPICLLPRENREQRTERWMGLHLPMVLHALKYVSNAQ